MLVSKLSRFSFHSSTLHFVCLAPSFIGSLSATFLVSTLSFPSFRRLTSYDSLAFLRNFFKGFGSSYQQFGCLSYNSFQVYKTHFCWTFRTSQSPSKHFKHLLPVDLQFCVRLLCLLTWERGDYSLFQEQKVHSTPFRIRCSL